MWGCHDRECATSAYKSGSYWRVKVQQDEVINKPLALGYSRQMRIIKIWMWIGSDIFLFSKFWGINLVSHRDEKISDILLVKIGKERVHVIHPFRNQFFLWCDLLSRFYYLSREFSEQVEKQRSVLRPPPPFSQRKTAAVSTRKRGFFPHQAVRPVMDSSLVLARLVM